MYVQGHNQKSEPRRECFCNKLIKIYGVQSYIKLREKQKSMLDIDDFIGINKLKRKIENNEAIDVSEVINFTISDEKQDKPHTNSLYITETPSFKLKTTTKESSKSKEKLNENERDNQFEAQENDCDKQIKTQNQSNQVDDNRVSSLTIDIKKKVQENMDYSSDFDKTFDISKNSDK